MAIRQGRNGPHDGLWRLLTLFLLVVSVLLVRSVWQVWQKNEESRTVRVEAEADMAAVSARYDELKERVDELETPRGQEAEIRHNFPVGKEGERVVIILDEDTAATTTPKKDKNWWQKFWTND